MSDINDIAPRDIRDRRGRVLIDRSLLQRAISGDYTGVALWNTIMRDFIIASIESNWMSFGAIYSGYHPAFDVVDEFLAAPAYNTEITRHEREHGIIEFTVKFVREP